MFMKVNFRKYLFLFLIKFSKIISIGLDLRYNPVNLKKCVFHYFIAAILAVILDLKVKNPFCVCSTIIDQRFFCVSILRRSFIWIKIIPRPSDDRVWIVMLLKDSTIYSYLVLKIQLLVTELLWVMNLRLLE